MGLGKRSSWRRSQIIGYDVTACTCRQERQARASEGGTSIESVRKCKISWITVPVVPTKRERDNDIHPAVALSGNAEARVLHKFFRLALRGIVIVAVTVLAEVDGKMLA